MALTAARWYWGLMIGITSYLTATIAGGRCSGRTPYRRVLRLLLYCRPTPSQRSQQECLPEQRRLQAMERSPAKQQQEPVSKYSLIEQDGYRPVAARWWRPSKIFLPKCIK